MKIGIDDSAGPEILGVKMRNSSGPLIGSVDVGTFLDCIQFSPDGTLLAAGVRGGNEDDIKIVDIRTGGVVKTLAGLGSQVIAFSPDGLTLAAGGRPKIVVLWDLNSGKPKRILRGHRGSIISLAFDVNGEKLASSAGDGLVKVWNALSGEELKSIEIENNWRPSPVATFHPKTNALIWTDGKNVKFQREDGSTGTLDVGVRGPLIRISADAKYLALGAGVGGSQIKIWELSSETYVRNCGETFQSEYILDFHPDGRLLASASTSGFKLWDVSSGKAIYWNDLGQVESVDFAPNGTVLATGGVYAEISFWDMSTILQSHRAQELAENCNESKRDRLELQGIWSGKEGNDPVAYEFNKSKVRFGGLGEIVGDQVDFWFSYSLDARATPKRIDIFREFDGVRHFMLRGVYRFEDAKLRIDYGRTAQSALPTTVHVGRGNTTVELQRFSTIEQ